MDMSSGLKNNYIHTIRKDIQHRAWIGTDNGLEIVNNTDSFLRQIIETLHFKPIWGIEFYKNYVIICSRYTGIYIYNLTTKKLDRHFDSSQISYCRRIRVFDDTILIATQHGSYHLQLKKSGWQLQLFKTSAKNDFFTDFVKWKKQLFAVLYTSDAKPENINSHVLLFNVKGDSLVEYHGLQLLPKFNTTDFSFLSAASNDSLLVLGGGGSYFLTNQYNKQFYQLLKSNVNNKLYPIWDIAFAEGRPFMVTGNPENNRTGMVYEPEKSSLDDLNNSFYGQTLFYDTMNKGMWIGTLNKGLFYWPFISTSYHIPKVTNGEFRYKPNNLNEGILFNENKIIAADLNNQSFIEIFNIKQSPEDRTINDVYKWNDTTAVLTNSKLIILKGSKKIIQIFKSAGDKIYKKDQFIYLFSYFTDEVNRVNLITNKVTGIRAPSYQIKGVNFNNNFLYASTNTGFHYFDSISHSFNIPFPVVESFTVIHDTLWVLNASTIQRYKIQLDSFLLHPIGSYNFTNRIPNFIPEWISETNGNLFCGNAKGFLTLNTTNIEPVSYTYLGNFKQGDAPIVFDNHLIFNQENYIAIINPSTTSISIDSQLINIQFSVKDQIFQHLPFLINFIYPDYLLQKHTLKRVDLYKNKKWLKSLYSIEDNIDFPSGLEEGNYEMVFKINDKIVDKRKINIAIPILSNPWFYAIVLLFLAAFIFVIFRNILIKRTYDKRLLENRLQLLKQNLNPHFIFNSLNLIYSLVLQKKNETAIKTINNFSDLHRYYLENINQSLIILEEELLFIESYLKLESERVELDSPFQFVIPKDLSQDAKEQLVPPMILQPLVENAVKYCSTGAGSSEITTIWIDVKMENGHLIIGVENTLDFSKELKQGTGLGKNLVLERIAIFNKKNKENILLQNNVPTVHCKHGYRCELKF